MTRAVHVPYTIEQRERCGARSSGHLQRMQKYRKAQRFDARENRLKQRVIEIVMVDVGTHVDAL